MLSPVDGVIVEVNAQVRRKPGRGQPRTVRRRLAVQPAHPNIKSTVKSLMTDTESLNWMGEEVAVLEGMIEEVAGPLAADGGFLQPDIFGNLPDLKWNDLTRKFLKT